MKAIIAKLKQKTTIAVVIGAIVTIARELGAPISQGVADGIVYAVILAVGFFAKDDSAK